MTDTTQPSAPSSTGTIMPLVSIRTHKWLALSVMLIVTAGGTVAAWFKGVSVYATTAVVYVAPRFANILTESKELEFQSNSQYLQFIEQQVRTINRYDIVLEALQKLGERRFLWQQKDESDRNATERLQGALSIRAVRKTYLITIGMESKQKEGLHEIVNAVVKTYLRKVKKQDIYAIDLRLTKLRELSDSMIKSIAEKHRKRTVLAQKLGVTTFVGQSLNPYDKLLLDGNHVIAKAQRQRIDAEAKLYAFDIKNKSGKKALEAAARELVSKDPGLNSLKANVFKHRSKRLEEISGLKSGHPIRGQAKREMKVQDQELKRTIATLMTHTSKMLLELRRAEVRQARQIEEKLQKQLAIQRKQAAWFATRYNKALSLSHEIRQLRKQREAVNSRIDFLVLESRAPGFVRLESKALPPIFPIKGGRQKLAITYSLIGVILGLVLPILVDLLDKRFKTAAQVEKLLGFRPLAAILERTNTNCLVAADQLRRLMLALERERLDNDTRCIVLMSVKPLGGTTSLALDLAQEFLQNGTRTLVIETNPLKPDARYLGEPPNGGLIEVLNGETTLDAVIVSASDSLPDRIPIGLTADRHLSLYSSLVEILRELRTDYDLILLDAPPILLSADAEFLAATADATLLVVGALQILPGELKRAAQILERIDPRLIAVIVNRLKVYHGGGYYSKMVQDYQVADRQKNF